MKTKKMAKKNAVIPATLILYIFLLLTPAFTADWPMWRNDASNTGSSLETINLPLAEKWHSTAPSVEENGAVVANGIVYMSTDDGKVYAFDVSTGFEVAGFPVSIGSLSYGTPAVDSINGKVYALASNQNLYAFNLDGSLAWTRVVGSVGNNYNEGPIIDEGYVYVKAGGTLRKYDAAGVLQWASPVSGVNTQPSIMGDYVYSNSEIGLIQKFDKSTGAEITGSDFPISTGASQSALTTVSGKIFHKSDVLYTYDAVNGQLLWSQPAGGYSTYYGSPAVSGGAVYVYGFGDGKLYAFDENTGATLAGFPSVDLNPGKDRNWGSPTIAGDKIFIGAGESQKLKVLGAAGTAQAGQVLAEYPTFSTDFQGFDLCSPVVSDGWVFAMLDGGGLYAFFGGEGPPPSGALVINGDESCTESQDVILTLDNNDNPDIVEMRISEDPFFTGASWEPYIEMTAWTLSPGFGTKTVYAQLKDTSGQLSNAFTDQIDYLESCGSVCGDGDLDSGEECDDGNTENGDGCSSNCELENQPPDCSEAAASMEELWPPNHKYVDIEIMGVTDPDGDPIDIIIDAITQDEKVNAIGKGDGNTSPDGAGVGTDTASVRSERQGTGNGRVYEISFTAEDDREAACSGAVQICVPHDQRPEHECIDDGQNYDSTQE